MRSPPRCGPAPGVLIALGRPPPARRDWTMDRPSLEPARLSSRRRRLWSAGIALLHCGVRRRPRGPSGGRGWTLWGLYSRLGPGLGEALSSFADVPPLGFQEFGSRRRLAGTISPCFESRTDGAGHLAFHRPHRRRVLRRYSAEIHSLPLGDGRAHLHDRPERPVSLPGAVDALNLAFRPSHVPPQL